MQYNIHKGHVPDAGTNAHTRDCEEEALLDLLC
jgi:hypothetical protein